MESSRAERFAPQTVSAISRMMESYSKSIQSIRDINRTQAIVQTLPPIETYTANIIEQKDLPSTLEKIRYKVLEGEEFLPVEKAVYRVIEILQSDDAAILPVPILCYAPNSVNELQSDIESNLSDSGISDSELNIFANLNSAETFKKTQPVLDSRNYAFSQKQTASSNTTV
ncbi:hypothetical protein ACUN90_35645, partial [Escherichia sp. SP-MK2]